MRGEIDCKAPGLQLLRHKALEGLRSWPDYEFLHVKRDWNQSADRLASAALQREEGTDATSRSELDDLKTLNRLDEILIPKQEGQAVKVTAITRSSRRRQTPRILQEEFVKGMRIDRIRRSQDEERWIANLKMYLSGELTNLSSDEAKQCSKIA